MRKLPRHLEGPLDNAVLDCVETITPWLHATGHTPNVITTYSLLCGVAAAASLWAGSVAAFVGWSALSYLWDCTDGHMARTYQQTSAFGDLYDHAVDVATFGLLLGVFWCRYADLLGQPLSWVAIGLFWLLPLHLMCAYLGSQQAILKGVENRAQHSGSMELLHEVWRHGPEDMPWLRYFSCATFRVCTFALVLSFEAVRAPTAQ